MEGEAFRNTAANEIAGVVVNLRFPGQYFDGETGLHYNHFRYFDAEIGRYITSDPIGLSGGLNTYGYVGANPTAVIDTEGLAGEPLPPNVRALKMVFELGYLTGEEFNRLFEELTGQTVGEWFLSQ